MRLFVFCFILFLAILIVVRIVGRIIGQLIFPWNCDSSEALHKKKEFTDEIE